MIERRPWFDFFSHLVLILGVATVALPLYVALIAATHTAHEVAQAPMSLLPGDQFMNNFRAVLSGTRGAPDVARMMWVSTVMAMIVALGKITVSMLSAFAVVYFRFPLRKVFFWMIFVTLMLPLEVRMLPTYELVADLDMLDSYAGLTLPLIASATATLLFRQFFLSVPDELVEAARIDGAGPMRFFRDILLPMSRSSIAALFIIQFIYGWNQYLWPLLMTTREDMYPIVVGIRHMIAVGHVATEWNLVMATALLAVLPPVLIVLLLQKWFIKGLIDSEK